MRILVVTPWRVDETRPRARGLIAELARFHEVRVFSAVSGGGRSPSIARESESTRVVRFSRSMALLRTARGVLRGRSLQQAYMDAPNVRAALREEISGFRPDVVYVNVLRMAQYLAEAKGIRTVLDLDEFRSNYYRQVAESSTSLAWRMVARLEERRMREAEKEAVRVADLVLVSSPADLREGSTTPIRLVRSPHALTPEPPAELDAAVKTGTAEHGSNVVFVGRQSYRANREAIGWFAKNVLPRLTAVLPDMPLWIVGDRPPRQTRALSSTHVHVTGRVPDVEPFYRDAAVSIAPVHQATGVQMKLIESLHMGVPCVVSPVVAHCAGVTHGLECLVADTPTEWVEAITSLLADPELGDELSRAGKDWVERMHSEAAVRAAFWEALAEVGLTASPDGRPRPFVHADPRSGPS